MPAPAVDPSCQSVFDFIPCRNTIPRYRTEAGPGERVRGSDMQYPNPLVAPFRKSILAPTFGPSRNRSSALWTGSAGQAMLTNSSCRDSKTEQRPDRPCPIRLDGAGGALCQVRRTQGYKGRHMTGRRLHLKRHEYQSDNLSIVRTDGRCSGGSWCYYGNRRSSWSG